MKNGIPVIIIVSIMILNFACNSRPASQEQASADQNSNLQSDAPNAKLLEPLEQYIGGIENEFARIPDERKEQLKVLAMYIKTKSTSGEAANLLFICTHNSRRSHMSQLWAQTAAAYYGIENVHCFSGGTETTAFNARSVRALRKAGFNIEQTDSSSNPVYLVKYTEGKEPVSCFSKKYDDAANPHENFVAVMTCSQADKTCPLVNGATLRVAIPYEDPKEADDTPEEEARYDERCRQIAIEMFYILSLVKSL